MHSVTIKSDLCSLKKNFGIKPLKHRFSSACLLNPGMIQELSSNEQLGSDNLQALCTEVKYWLEIKFQSQAAMGQSL